MRANVKLVDKGGNTPMQLAVKYGREQAYKLLSGGKPLAVTVRQYVFYKGRS